MITISHSLARRLIRQAVDSRLPDEQWAELQTHLETCAECAAYRANLQRVEKGVRRALQGRWGGGSAALLQGERLLTIPNAVIRASQARARRVEWAHKLIGTLAGLALLLVLVYFASLGDDRAREQAAVPTRAPTLAPSPTPTPTALPNFRGQVLYESVAEGNAEIYLLSSNGGERGPELTNLTRHPARDFAPAWSPDGEWIAFLSTRRLGEDLHADNPPAGEQPADKSPAGEGPVDAPPEGAGQEDEGAGEPDGEPAGDPACDPACDPLEEPADGKAELFLMHVAGSRLTQITDLPQIEWEGPLSWSADGKTIAVVGTDHSRSGASSVYLVSTDRAVSAREGLNRVGGFNQAAGPPRFAPSGADLAYMDTDGLHSWDVEANDFNVLAREISMVLPSGAPAIKAFHWQASGEGLIYTVKSTSQTYPVYQFKKAESTQSAVLYIFRHKPGTAEGQARDETRVSAFSVSPQPGRIAFLQDADRDECWTIHLIGDRKPVAAPREVPGLCVDGALEAASWASDGRWLVVVGHPQAVHTPSEHAPWLGKSALYAVQTGPNPRGAVFERLGDWSTRLGGTGEMAVAQVRPGGEGGTLGIQPHVAVPDISLPPTVRSKAPGQLTVVKWAYEYYEEKSLLLLSPATLRTREVTGPPWDEGGNWTCLSRSPDGHSFAFLHSLFNLYTGETFPDIPMHLKIKDMDGRLVKQFNYDGWAEWIAISGGNHYCPEWSPDGRWVAMPLGNQGEGFILGLHSLAGEGDYLVPLAMDERSLVFALGWTSDGQSVQFSEIYGLGGPARGSRVLEWSLADLLAPAADETARPGRLLAEFAGADRAVSLAFSPDGKQMALMVMVDDSDGYFRYDLLILDATTGEELDRFVIQNNRQYHYQLAGELKWGESGIFGIVGVNSLALYPYELLLYDPTARELRTVLYSEVDVWGLKFSPDSNWLVYATPDALWLLDLRGPHDPVLLLEGKYNLVDWR